MADIGKKLVHYRKLAGLTQDDLARLTGVSQSAISSIEIGRNMPTTSTAALLASVLKIPVSELIPDYENIMTGVTTASGQDTELVETVRRMVLDLPTDDVLKVYGFIAGLISARSGK